jgi:hypothetical protein
MASTSKLQLVSQAAAAADIAGVSQAVATRTRSFIAYQKLTALHAATTVVGKIQHSPDGTDWFDLAAFTSYAGSSGPASSETKQITDNVYPYVRGVATITGSTKLATVVIELHYQPML